MLQHFTYDTAIAASYNKDVLRVRVREQRRVCHHFVIDELVFFGRHDHAVEHEHIAPLFRLDHRQLLTALNEVRAGRCDRAMVKSLREQIDELRVVLTQSERDAVATVIAAVIWAVLDASACELDDTLVA